MSIGLILSLLTVHYLFDWVFQTRWMAENKSINVKALGLHVLIYTSGLVLLSLFTPLTFTWAIVNGILHFMVDYTTSRITRKAFTNQQQKLFWNTIGYDQLLHYVLLFLTSGY